MVRALSRRFGRRPNRPPSPPPGGTGGAGPPSRRRRRIGTPARPGRAGITRQPAPAPGRLRRSAFLASRGYSQRRAARLAAGLGSLRSPKASPAGVSSCPRSKAPRSPDRPDRSDQSDTPESSADRGPAMKRPEGEETPDRRRTDDGPFGPPRRFGRRPKRPRARRLAGPELRRCDGGAVVARPGPGSAPRRWRQISAARNDPRRAKENPARGGDGQWGVLSLTASARRAEAAPSPPPGGSGPPSLRRRSSGSATRPRVCPEAQIRNPPPASQGNAPDGKTKRLPPSQRPYPIAHGEDRRPPSGRRRPIGTPAGPRRGGTTHRPAPTPGRLCKSAFLARLGCSQWRAARLAHIAPPGEGVVPRRPWSPPPKRAGPQPRRLTPSRKIRGLGGGAVPAGAVARVARSLGVARLLEWTGRLSGWSIASAAG